jgi:hypothetical protein
VRLVLTATEVLLYLRTVGFLRCAYKFRNVYRSCTFVQSVRNGALFTLLYLSTVGFIRCALSSEMFFATKVLLYFRTVGLLRCAILVVDTEVLLVGAILCTIVVVDTKVLLYLRTDGFLR